MLKSLTGYASTNGSGLGFAWDWDLRSVNGKGLDIRVRAPDWLSPIETELKSALAAHVARGTVNLSLRLSRDEARAGQRVNPDAVKAALAAIQEIEDLAASTHVALSTVTAADILSMRGVQDVATDEADIDALRAQLISEFPAIVQDFVTSRAEEGAALEQVLVSLIDQVAARVADADAVVSARAAERQDLFRTQLARVLEGTTDADADRVSQELAMLAVKADITEELDRLRAHITAARTLIGSGAPAGRKLDFLMQEFNREANTLCAKAQFTELTQIGLDLKALIDQMREQVQNVE